MSYIISGKMVLVNLFTKQEYRRRQRAGRWAQGRKERGDELAEEDGHMPFTLPCIK